MNAASMPCAAPVGSFAPNDLGLYDMGGNVSEWCWDIYDPHYAEPALAGEAFTSIGLTAPLPLPVVENPCGLEFGSSWVVRGGSWRSMAVDARCASRYDLGGDGPVYHVGFRLVRAP